jgi:hypothetical protein
MKTKSTIVVATLTILTLNNLQSATAQSWNLTGNSNASSSSVLGTTNGVPLRMITNGSERIRITPTGDVGIGTSSPSTRFEIRRSDGNPLFAKFSNGATTGDRSALISMQNGDGKSWRFGVSGLGNGAGVSTDKFYIERYGHGVFMTITTDGNVGIGTTAPGYLLDVAGRMNLSNSLYLKGNLTMHAPGNDNFFAGPNAGNTALTGNENTATGSNALHSLTFGVYNTANGSHALYLNTHGHANTAIGDNALYNNITGNSNTAIGDGALYKNTTASSNTAIGESALFTNTTGNDNTALGYQADVTTSNLTNATVIGSYATVSASNTVRVGNSDVTSIGGYVDWSNISDGRIKKNIKSNVPGLVFINKLNPVTYNLDLDAEDRIIQHPAITTKDGKTIVPAQENITARKAKEQIVYTGLIAQDVEKAAKELNYDFSGVDAAKNDKDLYGLRYAEFVVPLVKAVQELYRQNQELQKQIDDLKGVKTAGTSSTVPTQPATKLLLTSTSLKQNNPNPFTGATTIHYSLPAGFRASQIIIWDNNGKAIKQVQLNTAGNGAVNIDASTLGSGTYNYSLVVDGKVIESKKMIVAH